MHILLVDDDEKIRSAIGNFLADRGHRLATASDGVEALERLEADRPDLVLCDIRMPGMNGLLLLQAARARFPHVPVILMTGDRDVDTAIAAFRSGAQDYLKKPIKLRELIACIERLQVHATEDVRGQ